jgi:hypothetical protein
MKIWAFFVLVALAFVVPTLFRNGANIVINSYLQGVRLSFNGSDPYLSGGIDTDLFKYSPLFAIFYWPFAQIPSPWLSLVWAFVNCGVFWWGTLRFFRLDREKGWKLFAAFFVLSLELNGSLRYQQVNALLVGLSLWGLADLRERGFRPLPFRGVGLLSLSANFKVLGLSLLGPLAFFTPMPWIAAGLASLLLPALVFGWDRNFELHRRWLERLFGDTQSAGLLDLATVLSRSGFDADLAKALSLAVLAVSAVLLLLLVRRIRQDRGRTDAWDLYAGLALAAVLLVNPRTESPTFVMASPAFWALVAVLRREGPRLARGRRRAVCLLWGVAFWMTSYVFNALWPRVLYEAALSSKTYGLLLLWVLLSAFAIREIRKKA